MDPQRKVTIMRVSILALCLTCLCLFSVGDNPVDAASTAKTLSTNFTLVNLGTSTATVAIQYIKDDGTAWSADAVNTSLSIAGNGGQAIIRQYTDATMTSGKGAATVSSDQPLVGQAQILARSPQVPTSGAYSAFTQTSDTFYLPLLQRKQTGSSGMSSSQVMVQNVGASSISVNIQLIGDPGAGKPNYLKVVSVPAGATSYYDLDDESSANVPDGWYGGAMVSSTGNQIAVVANLFTGANTLKTYNGFPASVAGTSWVVPLFTSRLANGLSTPVSFQNLSGGSLAIGAVSLQCIRDPAIATGPATITVTNSAAVPNNGSFHFNPVSDTVNFPTDWYGACRLTSSGNVVSFVQIRKLLTDNASAYEAISGTSTDKTVLVPLVSKRLGTGFASGVTIQNLSTSSAASVTFTYTPSAAYVTGGGSSSIITAGPCSIPASGSVIHNHRLSNAGTATCPLTMPDGWYGSLQVVSTNQPIAGIVQLTNINTQPGDTYMALTAFNQP